MIDTSHLPALPCHLNGELTTLREARISPLDRGFIFGDGIYEGIAVYGKPGHTPQPFRFEQHMARLERGLKETRIPNPHTREQWRQIALHLIAANPERDQVLDWFYYFQVTRGVALRDHPMLPGLTPTVFATCLPMKPPTAEQRAQGVACVTADDFRWQKAHLKSISLLGAVLSIESGSGRLHQVPGVVPSPREFVRGDRFAPRSSHPDVGLDTRPDMVTVPGTEHQWARHPELVKEA